MNNYQAVKMLEAADKVNQVPLLVGVHGIGKSSLVQEYARDAGLHAEVLILSLMEEGDLSGIPTPALVGGLQTTVWSAPDWYSRIVNRAWPMELETAHLSSSDPTFPIPSSKLVSREELNEIYRNHYDLPRDGSLLLHTQTNLTYAKGKRSVLLLDEFNRSSRAILNVSLQLLLDKRVHSHVLPVGTFVCAAINPSDDGNYTVEELDMAMIDRPVWVDLEADLGAWVKWARSNGVDEKIIDFLLDGENHKYLHFVPKDGKKGSSPRSWTRLSKFLSIADTVDPETFSSYVLGTVGSTVHPVFMNYYNNYVKSVSVADVIKAVGKSTDLAKASAKLAKLTGKLEVIQRTDLAHSLATHFKGNDKPFAYLAYLYSLPLEVIAAYAKELKSTNKELFEKVLVEYDSSLNDGKRALLLRVLNVNF